MRAASAAPAPVEIRSASKGAAQTRRRVPWSIVVPAGALAAGLLVWVAVHERTNSRCKRRPAFRLPKTAKPRRPHRQLLRNPGKLSRATKALPHFSRKISRSTSPPPLSRAPRCTHKRRSSTPSAVPPPAAKEFGAPEQDKLAQLDAGKSAVSFPAVPAASSGVVAGKRAVAAAPAAPKAAAGRAGGPLVANQMQNQMQNQNVTQNANQAAESGREPGRKSVCGSGQRTSPPPRKKKTCNSAKTKERSSRCLLDNRDCRSDCSRGARHRP